MKTLLNIKSVAVFAVLLAVFVSCNQLGDETEGSTNLNNNGANKIQKVEVVRPEQRSFKTEVLIAGTARPNQIVTLFAMEAGMLIKMNKDIGDQVALGETIAFLKNPELQQQQLKWLAETTAKKANFERLNTVYKKSPALTNIQQVENVEAEYLSAKTNLDAINNRVEFLSIKAPFSGVITKRFVDKGALIQSGLNESNPQALFELQEINPIRLTVPVPGSDAAGIQKGMKVKVSFPELSSKFSEAKVSRTSNALDPLSKTMQVEIDLNNLDGKIISGMYAKALLQINSRENILSLPIMTKLSHKNEDYVLIVKDDKVKRIPITIGISNQDYFEVLNHQINSETQVIVQGKGLVKSGQIVEPIVKK